MSAQLPKKLQKSVLMFHCGHEGLKVPYPGLFQGDAILTADATCWTTPIPARRPEGLASLGRPTNVVGPPVPDDRCRGRIVRRESR
jgi:hypothetical protein